MTRPASTRRDCFKALASAGMASLPSLGSASRPSPSNRVTVGVIGCGARGFANLQALLKLSDVQVTAVCDVDTMHFREHTSRKGRPLGLEPAKLHAEQHYARATSSGSFAGVFATADHRELCARDDLDAVLVATPDHWHALNVLDALKGGKDVYCEKPVTHRFLEGQLIYREVAKRGAIFQTGSQQRSEANFHRAVEIVRNGHLGKLFRVEVGLPAGYSGPMGSTDPEDIPAHLDYERWTGPAPMLPYLRARHHRWWRGHSAYGGGNIMDWIGHHNDIAHWGAGFDTSGPLSVEAVGWTWPEGDDVYDCPIDYEIRCEYPGNLTWSIASTHRSGTKWIGEDGWIWVNRGAIEAGGPGSTGGQKGEPPPLALGGLITGKVENRGPVKAYDSPGHHRNFIDGIKTRTPCVAPAETAHRSITPGHLAFVSQSAGRRLKWDTAQERIIGDDDAQAMLEATPYRDPWHLD